jgi:hypothetical protein
MRALFAPAGRGTDAPTALRHCAKLLAAAALGCATMLGAQQTSNSATTSPAPGSELRALDFFTGNWENRGEMRASEFGPAGPLAGSNRREWILNGFFQLDHHNEHNPTGSFSMVSIVGYDREKKVYQRFSFGADGSMEESEGTHTGDIWTWMEQGFEVEGVHINARSIITPTSSSSFTWKWQTARPGAPWVTVQEGTSTKKN